MQTQYVWDQTADPALYGAFINPDWTEIAWIARNTLQFMTIPEGELKSTLVQQDAIAATAWSPNSNLFATGSAIVVGNEPTPLVSVWEAHTNTLVKAFPITQSIQNISFSPDSSEIAVLDVKGVMRVFSIE